MLLYVEYCSFSFSGSEDERRLYRNGSGIEKIQTDRRKEEQVIKILKRERDDLMKEIEVLRNEARTLDAEIETRRSEWLWLEQERERMCEEMARTQTELAKDIEQLKAEKLEISTPLEEMRQEWLWLEKENERLKTENLNLQEKLKKEARGEESQEKGQSAGEEKQEVPEEQSRLEDGIILRDQEEVMEHEAPFPVSVKGEALLKAIKKGPYTIKRERVRDRAARRKSALVCQQHVEEYSEPNNKAVVEE